MIQGCAVCPKNVLVLICIIVKNERRVNACLEGGDREELY